MRYFITLFACIIALVSNHAFSQGSPNYRGGFKIQFNEDQPDKFLRIISWAQFQMNYQDDVPENESQTNFLLRRARLLFIGQISKDFTIVSHIGLNNLSSQNMNPVGTGDAAQVFLHDAWVQYNLGEELTLGGGLHYFNGISRLNNQSTLNMLTLDNNRSSWSTLGLSDQFARHIGVFAKGNLGKFQYQVAVNNAIANGLDSRLPTQDQATYTGLANLGSANALYNYAGYFTYHLFDKESSYLPYKVGSYLGGKKVLTLGTGFFAHPNGSAIQNQGSLAGEDVMLYAFDVFYDAPLGNNNAALTAYAVYQNNDYGENYLFGPYGSGAMLYGHTGVVIPGQKQAVKFQPYLSYALQSFDAVDDNQTILGIGANAYFSGHNSKLTLEYKSQSFGNFNQKTLSLQAMIYL
ncbi:hypothetical protein [Psychroflexus sediminis]|uniref:Short chain amide porin n=1 Tax=Psychroflexus sediminis TaxID=470826 RepID=A0A1G7WQX2_9FLAO|nr:hypothetical protein [Psychroflexus sediminis]SDG74351.1 short chain amide porin [Psychroflexus sediminis]